MFKILIADDNPLIRMGIKTMIRWGELHARLVGEAGRGDEILELLEKEEADLLITDIRMPGKDGLYVLQQTQVRYPNLETIVISAYDEFEYAKQALKAGSVDYILKPIDPGELNMAIAKALNRGKSNAGRGSLDRAGKRIDFAVLKCRAEYEVSVLGSILAGFEDLSIENSEGIFVLSCSENLYSFASIEAVLHEEIPDGCLLGKICATPEMTYGQMIEAAKETANRNLIEAAVKAGPVQHIAADLSTPRFRIENIMMLCKSGGSDELLDIYHEIRTHALLCSNGKIEIWAKEIGDFLNLLAIHDKDSSYGVWDILQKVRNQKERLSYVAQEEADLEIERAILEICKMSSRKKGSKEDLVWKVKEFVQDCYAQDISPGSIAGLFHVSLPYLSKIFKQETGQNLNLYITDVRISRAKYLLANTEKSVSDIAAMVGYEDVNYFIRTYKKMTGITPSKNR